MSQFYRRDSTFSIKRERGGFRIPESTKDAALTSVLASDIPEEGELSVLRTVLKRERLHTVGGGRKANVITELGYDPVDETVNFYLQTARKIFGAMGNCVTTGTSHSPSITGSVVSGGGTKIISLSGVTLVVDAHIGDMFQITSGPYTGYKYCIVDNDVSSVTVDEDTPSGLATPSFEIFTAPFDHQITEGTTLPTWAAHFDLPNEDSAERIINDLLGIIMKKNEITIEKEGDAIQAVDIIGAKSIEGGAITVPSDFVDTFLKWGYVSELTLSYDGKNPIRKEICDMIKMAIENDAELQQVVGDFWANFIKIGTVDYALTFNYFPDSKVLYDLRNVKIKDMVGDLDCTIQITEPNFGDLPGGGSWDKFIKFIWDKLYLDEHPTGIPSKDDALMGVEAVFKFIKEGSLIVQSRDQYGIEYYEGSTIAPSP